jgi:TPP-dependent pyruvate/acetoin dehydrogenase alpha subunit
MASLWQLPVLFVVENNEYAQTTPRELAFAGSIAARAAAFGIETAELSTTDVTEVYETAGNAVARVRETGAPFFLVLNTYRFSPHSKGDDFRDPGEIEERRKVDPLAVAGAALGDVERIAIEEACEQRLAATIAAAEAAPDAGGEQA